MAWPGICSRRPMLAKGASTRRSRLRAKRSRLLRRMPKLTSGWRNRCVLSMNAPSLRLSTTEYLALSNFDSGFGGQLNYYLAGYLFGAGSKKRAAQTDIWKELRSKANVGLCDCEWVQKRFDQAIPYCQAALGYTPGDLYANYAPWHRVFREIQPVRSGCAVGRGAQAL